MAASTGRHETRALLRAHLAAASGYRHLTRHCPICHRLLALALEPVTASPATPPTEPPALPGGAPAAVQEAATFAALVAAPEEQRRAERAEDESPAATRPMARTSTSRQWQARPWQDLDDVTGVTE
ncbi:DUF6274 family protein [Streptomyces atratus]|uniref:DUF6274 family protein n=1 Tax=Streptomyces atratus TaxID=1893 RepID=UPI0033D50863